MKQWKGLAGPVLAVLVVCCLAATGAQEAAQAAPANDDAASAKEIAAAGERILDAYLDRNMDRWLEGFTEDAVLMPPGVGMIVGRDALREASRIQFGWLAEYETEVDSDLLEIVVAGDWAYTRDVFELRYQPLGGGEPIVDRGRSLTIWERQTDGAWLVARHMVNRPQHGPG